MKKLALALTLTLLTACSTISGWFSNPTTAQYIQDAVDVAVLVVSTQGISAAEINNVAKLALAADAGAATTVAELQTLLNKEFASLKLPAADQAAIGIFVAALSAALEAKLGTNSTVLQTQVLIADVLNDLITATSPAKVLARHLKP